MQDLESKFSYTIYCLSSDILIETRKKLLQIFNEPYLTMGGEATQNRYYLVLFNFIVLYILLI